jgi:L-rhamnose isomerase/sugar isomerase
MAHSLPLSDDVIANSNQNRVAALEDDFEALGEQLERRGIDIEAILSKASTFSVAVPSWGVGTGGTRFARFPGPGEPRNIIEKIEDCAVIQQLGRVTSTMSPHFPWDNWPEISEVRARANAYGLNFDAVNSNTFQDQPKQALSYKYGSLTHTDVHVREQAIRHNIDCIEVGKALGSKAITVWIGDGSNFPGQQNLTASLERYLDSLREIYAALPNDWQLFIEHKLYGPAFYATVVQDWGTNVLCATELGDKARCLVDLGHHAPSVNIEMIVARLIQFKKLAGFHFNDSKYGDDDLDAGSIQPLQLFLVFNELVDAAHRGAEGFDPAYMLDQSHNVTDPIESLTYSSVTVQSMYVRALLVNRVLLEEYQLGNDVLMARDTLMTAYETNVAPLVAMSRYRNGGAIDPIAAYRASGYRQAKADERPETAGGSAGIV